FVRVPYLTLSSTLNALVNGSISSGIRFNKYAPVTATAPIARYFPVLCSKALSTAPESVSGANTSHARTNAPIHPQPIVPLFSGLTTTPLRNSSTHYLILDMPTQNTAPKSSLVCRRPSESQDTS